MAFISKGRVLETSTSTGVGTFALSAAVVGFRRFSAVCAVADTLPYFIEAVDALGVPTGDYEYGIGTYSAANTLTRTTVLASSNAGALVNFAAGSKNVGLGLNESALDTLVDARVLAVLNASGSAPVYGARAWVNFNGSGTVAIRASGNVSSITDNGVGDYTVNFTTPMPDASYSISGTAARSGTSGSSGAGISVTPNDAVTPRTVSACRVVLLANAGDGAFDQNVDSTQVNVVIHR
jgi:hypothetical protein